MKTNFLTTHRCRIALILAFGFAALIHPASAAKWYEKMEIGPAWANTFADTYDGNDRVAALKGLLVQLDHGKRALFDTETLSLITVYEGGVEWGGTPWTGAHGSLIGLANQNALINQASGPGWADSDDSFADPRKTKDFTHYGSKRKSIKTTTPFGNLTDRVFTGYYRHGQIIIFEYRVHRTQVLDAIEATADGFVRYLEIAPHEQPLHVRIADDAKQKEKFQLAGPGKLATDDGSLVLTIPASDQPAKIALTYGIRANPPKDLAALCGGGPGIWTEPLTTKAKTSTADIAWVVDTVTLPEDNPWHANLRFAAFDFLDPDRAALSTWNGDVWIVSGLREMTSLSWKRFASGLFEPLGLKVIDGTIYVHGRDQISKLHDLNDDGEADHYETFNRDATVSPNFHEFAFDLQTDEKGNLYYSKAGPVRPGGRSFDAILPHHGTVVKVTPDGSSSEVIATGLRAPGGLGVGPDGLITTGENEGTWQPCCKINYLPASEQPGFFGTEDTRHQLENAPYREPLVYLPMSVDNSSGSQVWAPKDANWGLKPHEMIHLSYGKSSLYRVFEQTVGDIRQGAVTRIPVKLDSSAMRARFHPDGSLYVVGFRGWQTNASRSSAFHRIRRTEKPIPIPSDFQITPAGFRIQFDVALDEELATDPFSFSAQRWDYVRGQQYGSGEFSVDHPDPEARKKALTSESKKHRKRDQIKIGDCRLLADKKTVEIDLAGHKPSMQLKVAYDLETTDGDILEGEIHATVHRIPEN